MVLRQDVYLMDAKLRFERCTDARSIKRAVELLDLNHFATVHVPPSTPEPSAPSR
jgi:hypothetical protein